MRDRSLRAEGAGQATFAPVIVSANVDPIEPSASAPAMNVEENASPPAIRSTRDGWRSDWDVSARIVVFADVNIEGLSRVLRVIERR